MTAIPTANTGSKRALQFDQELSEEPSAKTARISLSQLSPLTSDKNIKISPSQLSPFKSGKKTRIHNLLPELLEKILNLVSLKTIIRTMFVDRFFYHLVHEIAIIPKNIREFKEELPQSFSRILESIPALSLQIFQEELKIREAIIEGHYSWRVQRSTTKLKCLQSYHDRLVTCTKIPDDGFGIQFKSSFLKKGPFLDFLMHRETIYALRTDGSILVFGCSAAGCEDGVPLISSNSPIDRIKMQWPYLVGFGPLGMHIWNLTEKSLPPVHFDLEDPRDLVGISNHTLIVLTKNEENLVSFCFLDLNKNEQETITPPEGFTFVNVPYRRIHAELTSTGVALLLFKEADTPQEEPLRNDDSEPEDDLNGKNALDGIETISLSACLWHFNLLTDNVSEYPLTFLQRPSHTAFYKDTFYCWNRRAGVVGAICLTSEEQVLELPKLKIKKWPKHVDPPPPADNAAGLTWSLINGVVHTRSELVDLQSNTLVLISNTLCGNSFYGLDYRKVTYLPGGKLLRGHPSCIEILDFNNPLASSAQESTESSDS